MRERYVAVRTEVFEWLGLVRARNPFDIGKLTIPQCKKICICITVTFLSERDATRQLPFLVVFPMFQNEREFGRISVVNLFVGQLGDARLGISQIHLGAALTERWVDYYIRIC